MSRDAHIPLALWMCAAILGHLAGGSSAVELARVFEDRANVRAFVRGVRSELRPGDKIFELLMEGVEPTPNAQPSEAPDKDGDPSDDATEAEQAELEQKTAEAKPDETQPKPDEPKPAEPEKPKAEATPAEAQPPKPVTPNAPIQADRRIAIKQNVEKNQKDNPNASRIADDAHTTEDESQARIRAHDQDSPDPTPGAHAGPRGEVGDGDEDKSGQSEDKKGDPNRAPGEAKEASQSPVHNDPTPPRPPVPGAKAPTDSGRGGARPSPAPSPAPPPAPGGAGPSSPDTMQGEQGYSLDPANPGGDGKSRAPGRKRPNAPYKSPVSVRSMGLGAEGTPGAPNPNVKLTDVIAGVGEKQLKAERAADGASRRSKHRGSWETNKFERWRAAIENYEPSVKIGNQTSLNAARVPFATYINAIHNRLHPIFAEEFLASLDNLPRSHDLNKDLVTHIEIVLSKDDGRIVRMGVTKASGETAFDVVALNSVHRASPYGKAPTAIVSPDGNVYLHWEFHRDPFDACTTRNARPFLLKNAPTLTPAQPPTKRPPTLRPGDDGTQAPLLPLRQK